MRKKVFIFWSLLVAVAVFRFYQSLDRVVVDVDFCLKQNIVGQGRIVSEPEKKDTGQVFVIRADIISVQNSSEVCAQDLSIKVKTKLYPEYKFNDYVSFEGKLLMPVNFDSGTGRSFDYIGYLEKDDIYYEIKSAKISKIDHGSDHEHERKYLDLAVAKLFELKKLFVNSLGQSLGEPHSALAGGLVVGEKSALGKKLLEDFRKVGLIHIVVLSGYNITIIADAMRRILSFLPRIWGIIFGGLGVALFGTLVGGGATVVRSCLMAGIALTADLARRDYSVMRALIFVGLLMLIENPKILLHDPSFQLSFLATLGLIFLASPIENKIGFIPERFGLRGIVASTFATLIFVSPYILYTMGQISIVGVIVNILVLPFIPLTMLFVFLAGVIGMFSLYVATPFAWLSYFLLSYELFMVNNFAKLPFASLNVGQFSFWWVVGFYGVLTAFFNLNNVLRIFKFDIKSKSSDLYFLFNQFQKLSVNVLIDNPNELIYTGFYFAINLNLFGAKEKSIVFTRRTLKHLAEKGREGKRLLSLIPTIIGQPETVFKNRSNRLLIVKYFPDKEGEPHVVVIECNNENMLTIITSFVTDKKYLKNFEILWRTGTSFS